MTVWLEHLVGSIWLGAFGWERLVGSVWLGAFGWQCQHTKFALKSRHSRLTEIHNNYGEWPKMLQNVL